MSVAARFRLGAAALLLLLALAVAAAWLTLRASLPALSGTLAMPGVSAPVRIARDAGGVPTIDAATRADLFFAQGFLHAQERYFQMDLTRRSAAGELAELFGTRALDLDKRTRMHGFRLVAQNVVERMPPSRRALLDAYVAGVNAGLGELTVRPFEYLLLGSAPRPWQATDSALVMFAMYLDLHDGDASLDAHRGLLRQTVPDEVFAWLAPAGTSWDAPVSGPPALPPALPRARWFSNVPPSARTPAAPDAAADHAAGSNSWVVGGALTAHGGAMLANDMHLSLRVPNIWYRVRLVERGAAGLDAVGVSLPGFPGITVGSNGHLAWGFTNSYGDWSDRVMLRPDADDPQAYRLPEGSARITARREIIQVKGAGVVEFDVPMSVFGPILNRVDGELPVALRWTAHDPEATNLALLDMLDVGELDSALALANRSGIPPQNIVVAAADGRIGWTIAGRMPLRYGYDPRLPVASDAAAGWAGWVSPDRYPRVTDPAGGRLWTANARVVGGEDATLIGDGGYALGARAAQIRDGLRARERFDEAAMLDVALDVRGLFLARWRELMLASMGAADEDSERRARLREILNAASLRADIDAVAYRLVREFRGTLEAELLGLFVAPARAVDPAFRIGELTQREGPLWQVVSERPAHLLPPGSPSWEAYLSGVIDSVLAGAPADLEGATWGDANHARIVHPLSAALPPWLGRRLNMPDEALPGDAWMPRVQGPAFGASQRLVVAPGREAQGIFHMPAGQSGHPLSPFYRSDHRAWAEGQPSPLLPGPERYILTLEPGDSLL